MDVSQHESDSKHEREVDYGEIEERLKAFMRLNENKIQDLWGNNFIDEFHKYAGSTSDKFNWHRMGKFLEWAVKIYGVRVDELLKIATKSSKTLKVTKKPLKVNENTTDQAPPRSAVIRRKKGSNIVTNPEALNKPLEMIQIGTSAQLFNSGGDPKSKDMLCNVLSSHNSSLTFPHSTQKFWDSKPYSFNESEPQSVLVDDVEGVKKCQVRETLQSYEVSKDPLEKNFAFVCVDLTADVSFESMRKKRMSQDSGYDTQWTKSFTHISDTEMDFEVTQEESFDDHQVKAHSTFKETQSCLEDTHDEGMGVEFTSAESQNAMEVDSEKNFNVTSQIESQNHIEEHQEETFTAQDQSEDFLQMPTTSNVYEYTYQPQETMKNDWASPSYWKFIKRRSSSSTSAPKVKRPRLCTELTLDDVLQFEDKLCSEANVRRRVHLGHHTLPEKFDLSSIDLNTFSNQPEIEIEPLEGDDEDSSETSDYEQATQQGVDEEDFKHEETENQNISFELDEPQILPLSSPSHPLPMFGKHKKVNMRDIKDMTVSILESETALEGSSMIKFSELASKCTKMMENEGTSTALIFFAILHKVNEGKFEIEGEINMIDDFKIKLK